MAMVVQVWTVVAAEGLEPREGVIGLRGELEDEAGLAYDGVADFQIDYYGQPDRDATPPLYTEGFDDVEVARGVFSLPLLDGETIQGDPDSVESSSYESVFVDVSVNGAPVLELEPLGAYLTAVRAEEADAAYGLAEDLELSNSDIPVHEATKVTSGQIDPARLPSGIDAARFSAGTLAYESLPPIPASNITEGVFPATAIPEVLDASIFTTGTIPDAALPDDIIVEEDIYVGSGSVGHLGVIPIPIGFTRDYCQWIVGIKNLDGFGGVDQFRVYTDQNGVVTCRWSPDQADSELNHYCTASYLVVCMK